jgi:hypothetical protein
MLMPSASLRDSSRRYGSHPRFRYRCVLISFLLSLSIPGRSPAEDKSKSVQKAAEHIVTAVQKANLQKLLVVDFLDESGARTEKGVYLAASLAKETSGKASGFATIDREKWFSLLESKAFTPNDPGQAEGLRRICAALECDGVVTGLMASSKGNIEISVSLRYASTGLQLARASFEQKQSPDFEVFFPAVTDPSGIRFYFSGLDGITETKCESCPNPLWSEKARLRGIQGWLVLSLLLGTDGVPLEVKLMNSLEPAQDSIAVEEAKRWKFEPCRDPSGRPVAVRIPVKVHYKLL